MGYSIFSHNCPHIGGGKTNENFKIFGGLYTTQWNTYDGIFIMKLVSR